MGGLKNLRSARLAVLMLASGLAACVLPGAGWPGLNSDLTSAVDGYLAAFLIEPAHGGQVHCASETLEVEQTGDAVKAWVWALCEEFYRVEGALQVGASHNGPLIVYLFSNEDDFLPGLEDPTYMATGFSAPRDGSLLADDIARFFPPAAIERMCLEDADCGNARTERLEEALEQKVHLHCPLPIATDPAN
ncbi:MAG: hypothetical protein P8X64_02265 [Anaerolineales bacterium]